MTSGGYNGDHNVEDDERFKNTEGESSRMAKTKKKTRSDLPPWEKGRAVGDMPWKEAGKGYKKRSKSCK